MLAGVLAGRKLVLWSRTLCCCAEVAERCKLRESGNSQRQGHRGRAGAMCLSVCTKPSVYTKPRLTTQLGHRWSALHVGRPHS